MSTGESSQQTQNGAARPKTGKAPGALRGPVWLTLQTRQALQLVRGRNATRDKPAILGLVQFAERLRLIWQAARDDDPWADWWLVKVHESIEAGVRYFQARKTELEALLTRDPAMDITVAGSERPSRISLQFANPYAYRGARLLGQYDTLVCMALTAHRVGLLDSGGSDQVIRSGAHKLRSTFTGVYEYRFTGANRELFVHGDARCDVARKAMGEVPNEIVDGELRAPITPRKLRFPTAYAEHATLQAVNLPMAPDPAHAENDAP
ncbi:MAG: TIGR03761 family integrating conjugative element protein [Gammaproteobacteria bacterium]|nr:TIGR03761 family integrating conjugative element protein [Gammaproteobacteria bacterium]